MLSNLAKNLEKKGYKVSAFDTSQDASNYLESSIQGKIVGFGDSITINKMGLHDILGKNNEIHSPMLATDADDFIKRASKALNTDIFLLSVNAITQKGEIVNIDGTGNRVAGSLFNHEKVIFVIGKNKIVDNIDAAIWRARNIAAPQNAKRLGLKTPCAIKADKCYDCKSPDRICNALTIHMRKMNDIDMEVILINEDIGL